MRQVLRLRRVVLGYEHAHGAQTLVV
jgi:hypothetical protein